MRNRICLETTWIPVFTGMTALLFYRSAGVLELNGELVCRDVRPIQLIVPGGTWRQARKIRSGTVNQ